MRPFRFAISCLPLLGSFALCNAAHADSILGSSVTGALYFNGGTVNYFDPNNGFVPAGYKNTAGTTVTIGPDIEFGYQDTYNTDTANFTDTTLTVKDVDNADAYPFQMTFTDSAFTGFTQDSGVAAGYSYKFSGHTLNVLYAGSGSAGTFTGKFSYAAAPTPEPSSLVLLGSGLLGTVGAVRRRRKA